MEIQDYTVIQIDKTSWRIEDKNVRCFLFTGSEKALLVDSGFGSGNLKAVIQSLTSLPVLLVNTHADRDHIGGNVQFGPPHMHPAEFDRYQINSGMSDKAKPLWEHDIIDIGGHQFEIILIPGHTPGSIALLDRKNKILIGGDSVMIDHIFMFKSGRNLPAYAASMEKLNAMRDCFDVIYPCHGVFPVYPELIDELLTGAKQIIAGELESVETSFREQKIRLYQLKRAGFLCDE